MKIILYSIDCPKCKILETKLNDKGFEYTTITDAEIMEKLGLTNLPVLTTVYDFGEAVNLINGEALREDE